MKITTCGIVVALGLAGCGGGGGGGTPAVEIPPPLVVTHTDPTVYSSLASASLTTPNEIASVTQHTASVGGTAIAYTATAGHLTATSLESGQPSASFFYIAYTANGRDPATRPVMFFFNGGPGSASVWLHLGSFGPKRLVADAPSTARPTPFPLVDNAETLLDVSDLVFVNAVGTGWSQAIAPNTNQSFYGVDADAVVFRDFIRRYVAANGRALSPKFVLGESYGGPRLGVLSRLLEQAGVGLRGVVLYSPVMDYNNNCGTGGAVSCGGYVPSYAATGAFHLMVNPPVPAGGLAAYMDQMRTYTATRFEPVASAGLQAAAPADVAAELAARTGLNANEWALRINVAPPDYRNRLIQGTLLGRYDARMTALQGSDLASQGDPSSTFITNSFIVGIGTYMSQTLKYTTPSNYVLSSGAIQTWNFSHDGRPRPDTIPDLATAMALNPRLKVFAMGGYHDLATPFHATERDLARLPGQANIQVRNYEGGHMTYLTDSSRVAQKADLAQWVQGAMTAAELKAAAAPVSAPPVAKQAPLENALPVVATMESPLVDPWVPPHVAKAVDRQSPTKGAALRAQVESKVRQAFDAADPQRTGAVTKAQAQAAGFGWLVQRFDAIDAGRTGSVRFADVLEHLEK